MLIISTYTINILNFQLNFFKEKNYKLEVLISLSLQISLLISLPLQISSNSNMQLLEQFNVKMSQILRQTDV